MNFTKVPYLYMIIIFLMILISPAKLKSQNTLTIEIHNIENAQGKILLELSDAKGKFISGHAIDIFKNKSVVLIKNLHEGNYTFRFFHDANNNKKLDTNWIGMPTEGFGFSNNVKGTFGPPSLSKTVFKVKGNSIQKCAPLYF